MRFIVCGFHRKSHFPIFENILNTFDIDFCHIIFDDERINLPNNIMGQFYQDDEINRTAEYPIPQDQQIPIDDHLLSQLEHCEINALKMMDRLGSIPEYSKYDHRKLMYLRHIRYWNHIFSTENIDLVIFDNIPHQIYDYIIYNLARLNNVKIITLFQLQIEDSLIFFNDYKNHSPEIERTYKNLLEKYSNTPIEEIKLIPRFERQVSLQLDKSKEPVPFYVQNLNKKSSIVTRIKSIYHNILSGKTKLNPIWIFRMNKKVEEEKKLFEYFESLTTPPDFSKNYVYLGLHYQPELTTCPLAGVFVDQLLIIQMIAHCLPENVLLYVKEHPAQKALARSYEFYNDIAKIPNVKLISRSVSSFELIKHSRAVATATGTVGWEALFRGKPVFLFGHIFYEYIKGVHPIQNLNECKNAIKKVFTDHEEINIKDIIIYLKALEYNTVEGYVDSAYKAISKITEEKNNQNISEALINKIKLVMNIEK